MLAIFYLTCFRKQSLESIIVDVFCCCCCFDWSSGLMWVSLWSELHLEETLTKFLTQVRTQNGGQGQFHIHPTPLQFIPSEIRNYSTRGLIKQKESTSVSLFSSLSHTQVNQSTHSLYWGTQQTCISFLRIEAKTTYARNMLFLNSVFFPHLQTSCLYKACNTYTGGL